MEREGFIIKDTDIHLDDFHLPESKFYVEDFDLPELKFDLEDFTAESMFEAIGIKPEVSTPVEIRIKGKRIWWKPWRRRPDTVYHFPNVKFSFIDDETLRATI